ncbi:nitroreductase family protein [Allosphingosinicella sp.]|jgi:nitroreductase|uniref:nitroreductase family protein n=1 Tax=Allosphingosinicella sp. TaxID=2823234 RepID=UPI002EF34768
MFNDRSSLQSYLATRRSCRPRDLVEPGPDPAQLRRILEIAARTPDHGKLFPWRFVHVARDRRPAFAEKLHSAYRSGKPEPPARLEIEAVQRFATQAPELVILLSSPIEGHKIPVWEQELSCGAVAMNLLHAASAFGFGAGWVTGWAAYSPPVLELVGGSPPERIAGFFFLGTGSVELEERPRPVLEQVVRQW